MFLLVVLQGKAKQPFFTFKYKGGFILHGFGKIIELLDAKMTTPTMYGWFHLLFFAIAIFVAVILCTKCKNPSEQTVKKVLLIFALVSIVLEIYKQFNYTFSFENGVITADYQWYAFPFQFCSTPMYIALLAVIIKNKKIHTALCNYLATFSLFAGICVMVYPPQVFIDTIGINIQTMICHGSMISLGVWLLCSGYIKLHHKTILPATAVFAITVAIATVMNKIAHVTGLLENETFNMFYISPYCDPSLPVYSLVQKALPYPLDVVVYVVVFSLAAYVILLTAIGIKRVTQKRKITHDKELLKTT